MLWIFEHWGWQITIIKLFFFFICCLHFDFALLNAHATSGFNSVPEVICQNHLGKLTLLFHFTKVRHEWHAVGCKEKQKDIHFQRIYNTHAHVKCLLQKSLTFVKSVPFYLFLYKCTCNYLSDLKLFTKLHNTIHLLKWIIHERPMFSVAL